jgi:oxaloacetate decarboxylase gamma subunit
MTTDIQTALTLLLIGMLAVFTILALVVLSGRGLIALVNKYSPEKVAQPIEIPKSAFRPRRISRKKLAAITAAVDQTTHGMGRITEIKKLAD